MRGAVISGFAVVGVLALLAFSNAPDIARPPATARLGAAYVVQAAAITDEKAVFATVESANVVPARARNGGTLVSLAVKQGDKVEQGQVIATIGDQKLALQESSLIAQVSMAQSQLAQAKIDLDRAEKLLQMGGVSRAAYDQAKTAYELAADNVKSISAQRSVLAQQLKESAVLAPTAGRVIAVPVTAGTVVLQGDTVATIARGNFVLRLQVPERHARLLKAGDPVHLDETDLGLEGSAQGKITLIYPEISNGRVVADAAVAGLGDYFVGERVRVWVPAGTRQAIVVPGKLLITRSGIDYVRLATANNEAIDVPVQRGEAHPTAATPDGVEILSGLHSGDRLFVP